MSERCVFSRRESGFQRRPFGHTWGERGQREPEDPDHWHRHRPVHLKHGARLTSSLNIDSAHFRRVGAEGPWKLLFLPQRSARMLAEEKQPSYSTHSALWRTCQVFSARAKTCRAASPVLFRARKVVFSCSKSKRWSRRLSFLPPDSCCLGFRGAHSRLHSVFSPLQLLHLHFSKPKLHFPAPVVLLLRSTNEGGPKTQSANMNVFLPCCVCISLVLE